MIVARVYEDKTHVKPVTWRFLRKLSLWIHFLPRMRDRGQCWCRVMPFTRVLQSSHRRTPVDDVPYWHSWSLDIMFHKHLNSWAEGDKPCFLIPVHKSESGIFVAYGPGSSSIPAGWNALNSWAGKAYSEPVIRCYVKLVWSHCGSFVHDGPLWSLHVDMFGILLSWSM